ncbi:MAG: MltA domain-containing protein [Candidatus Binatia bacterium]|nr:MltA domain-containing protein [Candidatus Binatia bacterium]
MRKLFLLVFVACWCGASGCVRPAKNPVPVLSEGLSSGSGELVSLVALDDATCRQRLRDDATPDSLQQAAERNADYLMRFPPERRLAVAGREVTIGALLAVTRTVLQLGATAPDRLCEQLRLYQVRLPEPLVVMGYYQPELRASRRRTERFRYPVYRIPDDLVDVDLRAVCSECPARVVQGRVKDGQLVPYYTRAEIELGALSGRGYELAWLDDPVEAYFLHVQGSALLELEDGVRLQISYAGSNGHPYRSLAKILRDRGQLGSSALTLRGLKDYLRAHPQEQSELFAHNPRWVFFRAVAAGPMGSCSIPLTPGRSAAVDPAAYPHGALAWLEVEPRPGAAPGSRGFRRLVFFQDTGTTITGTQRVDIFWGNGTVAEAIATELENPGQLYLLLPKE